MTHPELVDFAAKRLWRGCAIVITEMASSTAEQPDAIGWTGTTTVLIECKASRSDFLADCAKWCRKNSPSGMGAYRYYLTTPGIIRPDELPPNWGLMVVENGKVRVKVHASPQERNLVAESAILISALRRTGTFAPSGICVKVYKIDRKGRATLGVKPVEPSAPEEKEPVDLDSEIIQPPQIAADIA